MASKLEFVEFVTEQIRSAKTIKYRKMFGEYAIYCDEKVVALICNDQLYVKQTESGRNFIKNPTEEPPYKGAKPSFLIENIDDSEWMTQLIELTYEELPIPKKKKKKLS